MGGGKKCPGLLWEWLFSRQEGGLGQTLGDLHSTPGSGSERLAQDRSPPRGEPSSSTPRTTAGSFRSGGPHPLLLSYHAFTGQLGMTHDAKTLHEFVLNEGISSHGNRI